MRALMKNEVNIPFLKQAFLKQILSHKLITGTVVSLLLVVSSYYTYLHLRSPRENLLSGNYSIAFSQYSKKANYGNASAQTVIGNLYFLGLGVKQNKLTAARWYLKAALKGYVPAQINLGQMYWNGQGLPLLPLKAMGWFHLARKNGSKRANGHIRYMIRANVILTNMIQEAKIKYDNIDIVNNRFSKMGETAFLFKQD